MAKRIAASAFDLKPSAAKDEIHYVDEPPEAPLSTATEEDRLLPIEEVLRRIPVSKSTWYAGMNAKRFPQPTKMGRSSFWPLSEINLLVAGRWQGRASA